MSESILPVSPEPILATASSSAANTTQTEALEPVDKCRLEKDALRGILMELKRGVKVMQERQDALHRCMTGRALTDTRPVSGFDAAGVQRMALVDLTMTLNRIAITTGIEIE